MAKKSAPRSITSGPNVMPARRQQKAAALAPRGPAKRSAQGKLLDKMLGQFQQGGRPSAVSVIPAPRIPREDVRGQPLARELKKVAQGAPPATRKAQQRRPKARL